MFVDKELLISDGQSISASGDNLSENAINLGVARNIAKGKPLHLVVCVDEDFAGTGANVSIQVITATAADLTTGQKVLIATPDIGKALMTAGRIPIVVTLPPLPAEGGAQQYMGANFYTDGTMETTGKVTAFIAVDAQTNA